MSFSEFVCTLLVSNVLWSFTIQAADPLAHWQLRNPTPTTEILNDIAFHDGLFVAVGQVGTILTSPDGADWTTQAAPTVVPLNGVAYGGAEFVAVGNSGCILSSTDGTTWTARR